MEAAEGQRRSISLPLPEGMDELSKPSLASYSRATRHLPWQLASCSSDKRCGCRLLDTRNQCVQVSFKGGWMTGRGFPVNINACPHRQPISGFCTFLMACGQARGAATRIQLTVLRVASKTDMQDRGHPSIWAEQ